MSKEKNDLFVVILFSIILIFRPISYDEMRSRHSIYPQENVVAVNSSSISTKNDELEFLESNNKEIILVKDSSGSFFAEGFSTPLPRRPSSTGNQITMGLSGSNPDPGGGSSNPGLESEAGSCSSNPTPKVAPEVNHFTPQGKKKKNDQCPVDSIGEPSKGPSSEMIINSNYQDQRVIITDRDVKKFMTPEDRKRFDDQIVNENIYKNEIGISLYQKLSG